MWRFQDAVFALGRVFRWTLNENDSPCHVSFCNRKFPAQKRSGFGLCDAVSRRAGGQFNVIGSRRPSRIELARAAADQADARVRRQGSCLLGSPVVNNLLKSTRAFCRHGLRACPYRAFCTPGLRACRYRAFCRPELRACPLHWSLLRWRTLTTLWHR
jgi:hypothetical protein